MPLTQGMTVPRGDLAAPLNASIGQDFVFPAIFPTVEVPENTGNYGIIPTRVKRRRVSTKRTNKSGYPQVSFQLSEDTYRTTERGLEVALDDREANIYANHVDFERTRADLVLELMKLDAELEVAGILESTDSTTGWPLSGATGTDVTVAWSNPAADIIGDVATAQRAARASGFVLRELLVNWDVWWFMSLNTAIRAAIGADQDKEVLIDPMKLARLLNLEKIHIATAMYDNSDDGQDASFVNCYSSAYAHLLLTSASGSIEDPCVGNYLHWAGDGGGTMDSPAIEQYITDGNRGSVLRGRAEVQAKVKLRACHHLLKID